MAAIMLVTALLLVCIIWNTSHGILTSSKDQLFQSNLFYKRAEECLINEQCRVAYNVQGYSSSSCLCLGECLLGLREAL